MSTAPPDTKRNCPYCDTLMEYGVIVGQRDTGILWLPMNARSDRVPNMFTLRGALKKRNGRLLSLPSYTGEPPRLDAWICPSCGVRLFK